MYKLGASRYNYLWIYLQKYSLKGTVKPEMCAKQVLRLKEYEKTNRSEGATDLSVPFFKQ